MRTKDGLFELEIIMNGEVVREFVHEENVFVQGKLNSEFQLRVKNHSDWEVSVVISFDGLSVMNGEIASRKHRGYVIVSGSEMDIPGWRISDEEVASFYFGSLPEAYASQKGKPDNIGIIGAAFYHDKWSSLGIPPMAGGIGTGFGKKQEHNVSLVRFDRGDSPVAEIFLRYDDKSELDRMNEESDERETLIAFPADQVSANSVN